MMFAVKKSITILLATAGLLAVLVLPAAGTAYATIPVSNGPGGSGHSHSGPTKPTNVPINSTSYNTGLPHVAAGSGELQTMLRIAFGIIGAIALLFVVIGGLRYVLAGDNPQDASKARDTIIYASIGLIIVMLAETIIAFVLDKL